MLVPIVLLRQQMRVARLLSVMLMGPVGSLVGGCTDDASDDEDLVAVLDGETGKADSAHPAELRLVASASRGLSMPADLGFDPRRPNELWIVNAADDSVVTVRKANQRTGRTYEYRKDGYSTHFMANPMAIAFGADPTTFGIPGTFATCGESRNTYSGTAPPNDFMGPVLWSSDPSIFAVQNPYGLGSHIDMMHETPLCAGIAHERDNVYWAAGGHYGGIYKYDFQTDHHIGRDDHSDGKVYLYAKYTIGRIDGVPMGLEYRSDDQMLYIADTGNGRVLKLDTTTGTIGSPLPSPEPLYAARQMLGVTVHELVTESSHHLTAPSGLALDGDELWIADNANGRVSVFDLSGARLRFYETGLPQGALGGITIGPDGNLYLTDMASNRVLRLEPGTP